MPTSNNRFLRLSSTVLCIVIIILLFVEIILNLTPPISRDALIHHLAIPKLWIQHGGVYEIKWSVFSYYPMNIDMLYLIPLYFHKDFLAKFIHMGFGFGTAIMVYFYLKNRIGRIAGLLGTVLFISTPIVFLLSTQAYVDLGLTFFTTASILSFIRLRDSRFTELKWLLVSSVSMGLALGTKYNALIVWFFLTASIVFVYARDTKNQSDALKHGLIFFMISLFIFSPWLIKNTFLTGNPLYPLFRGFFDMSNFTNQEGAYSITAGTTSRSIFQFREMMYGENFWDTLLIPIRYFFEGQDNVHRYFDGVLNPILILLPPFAFMRKEFYHDKLFFISFTAFVIIAATFLDQTRIRYILPVVPFLCILTVMGFFTILKWNADHSTHFKYPLAVTVTAIFILFLFQNVLYIKNHYQTIAPMNYILGKESRDDFLTRHLSSYPAMKYINTHAPLDAKVRIILLAGRGYYLDREYEDDRSMGMSFVSRLVQASHDEKTFQDFIHSSGFTHFLVKTDLFIKYLQDNYSPDELKQFLKEMRSATEIIYQDDRCTVYRILPRPPHND